jgi:hypothetical protein
MPGNAVVSALAAMVENEPPLQARLGWRLVHLSEMGDTTLRLFI